MLLRSAPSVRVDVPTLVSQAELEHDMSQDGTSQDENKRRREELCVSYVAVTRAVYELYFLQHVPGPFTSGTSPPCTSCLARPRRTRS